VGIAVAEGVSNKLRNGKMIELEREPENSSVSVFNKIFRSQAQKIEFHASGVLFP